MWIGPQGHEPLEPSYPYATQPEGQPKSVLYRALLGDVLRRRLEPSRVIETTEDGQTRLSFTMSRFDGGVSVGAYVAKAGGDIMSAISLALNEHPHAVRFVLPAGNWQVTTPLTEARGLRDNVVFDGLDPFACRLYRATTGQMFRFLDPGHKNIVFRGLEMALENPATGYGASINGRDFENILVENCRFVTTFTDQTDNGIYHGIGLHGGRNLVFRNNYTDGAQVTFGALGVSIEGCTYSGNVAINCNDYAVSAVGGHATGTVIRDVLIQDNRFHGSRGGGYIYVGSDAVEGEPNPDMRDVLITDNVISGPFLTGFEPEGSQTRMAIVVSLGHDNRRISVSRNTISNDDDAKALPVKTRAIMCFVRNSDGGLTEDLVVDDNQCDFSSADAQSAIQIEGTDLRGIRVRDNTVQAGSRGVEIANASHVDVSGLTVYGATSAALHIRSPTHVVEDINVEKCLLETTQTARPGVLVSGAYDMTGLRFFRCNIRGRSVSIQNNLTDPAALQFSMNFTTTDRSLGVTAIPDEGGLGNVQI